MLNHSGVSKGLLEGLGKLPDKAERLKIAGFEVDILQFNDRPYRGATSVITNGVSKFFPTAPFEFVIIFEPDSANKSFDANAFVATYLQFHFLSQHNEIRPGNYFTVPGNLIRGYDFSGVYTTRPAYFEDKVFFEINGVEFFWLIPIFDREYDFINSHGADAFESCLVEEDPNLCRLDRLPVTCDCQPR
jgi:hypothetical protein